MTIPLLERNEINMRRTLWIGLTLVLLALWPIQDISAQSPNTNSWIVHGSVDAANMERGPNLLKNPGFESGSGNWILYTAGSNTPVIDRSVARGGSKSVRIDAGSWAMAVQTVTLNQPFAKPFYYGGWSKGENAPSGCKMQYSLNLVIRFTDGSQIDWPYACFDGGTTNWQHVDEIFYPDKPVATVAMQAIYHASGGKVWFDDLAVGEYVGNIRTFDDANAIYGAPDAQPWAGSDTLSISSDDGLTLGLSEYGGAIVSATVDGQSQVDPDGQHAGGFFVRDVAAGSDYVHLGGTVQQQSGKLIYHGQDAALGLDLTATFQSGGDHIIIDASLSDTSGSDRAISLYFALPVTAQGRTWWQDIRTSHDASSLPEHRFSLDTDWGANGQMSHYNLSSLTSSTAGLALAYPMDQPVISRFAYNASTYQYYIVCDVGLSAHTVPNPRQADLRLLLYKHDPQWGFRAAFQKYAGIYPQFFERRVEEDGIWVAHAGLEGIPDIEDFSIQFHETGDGSTYPYDDSINTYTLRYLTEVSSYWLRLPTAIPNDDYDAVIDYVANDMLGSTEPGVDRWANVILSSSAFDSQGRYLYEPGSEAFASHAARFMLNANPELDIPEYYITRAEQSWNDSIWMTYDHPEWGTLDGEYIDCFESMGLSSNYRETHFASNPHPLTFGAGDFKPVLPHLFSSYEFTKRVGEDVHARDRLIMGNSVLLRWSFPAHLFDIMGSERPWLNPNAPHNFQPDPDSLLNLWRTFAYHKPYCVLQNGRPNEFDYFTHDKVEQYFAYSAFYGIYPSFFTDDGGVTNYWSTPTLYERDRDLYIKYIPKIIALNGAGWEPVTYATSNSAEVFVERYGDGEDFYITLRNDATVDRTPTISVDVASMGLPASDVYTISEWLENAPVTKGITNGLLTITLAVPAKSTRILHITSTGMPSVIVHLKQGWNMVSLPGEPVSSLAADLLAPLSGHYDIIYLFDGPSQSWLTYTPGKPFAQAFDRIEAGQGLWVYATENVDWPVYCVPQQALTVSLYDGWNLVGMPLDESMTMQDAATSLGSNLDIIYSFDPWATDSLWKTYLPGMPASLSLFTPGYAYWIKVNAAADWYVTTSP